MPKIKKKNKEEMTRSVRLFYALHKRRLMDRVISQASSFSSPNAVVETVVVKIARQFTGMDNICFGTPQASAQLLG